MNAYSFPENVPLSEASKNLITRILITDPSKRLTLTEILAHEFFNQGNTIPKILPPSTLACPPSASYLRQFLPGSSTSSNLRLTDSTSNLAKTTARSIKDDFINTDRPPRKEENNRQLRSSASTVGSEI